MKNDESKYDTATKSIDATIQKSQTSRAFTP